MRKILIATPFYNCEKFLKECLESVQTQKFEGEVIHFVYNDGSTDNSEALMSDYVNNSEKAFPVVYIRAPNRMGGMVSHINIMTYMEKIANKSDIVIHLDGDDKFLHNEVLTHISNIYDDDNIWATYGSYESSDGTPCVAVQAYGPPREKIRTGWPYSHLRSFRFGLFPKIPQNYFQDQRGVWLTSACDTAIMTSIFELCGMDRVKFVPEKLYYYRIHENCDHKVDLNNQARCALDVASKTPLKELTHADFFIIS